ncbi:MAG: hypothetical protein P1V35_10740 [Planctomycetota bacterium]|nr:hypothetical protein [Planctomycetota bacterium]
MPTPPNSPLQKAALAPLWGLILGVKHWAPVWIPGLLLWQFASKGLQPALVEAQRLQDVTPGVEARHGEAKEAFEQVQAEAKAWQDPVYRERMRRSRFQETPDLENPGDPDSEELAGAYPSDEMQGYAPTESSGNGYDPVFESTDSPALESGGDPWISSQGTWTVEQIPLGPEVPNGLEHSAEPEAWTTSEPHWGGPLVDVPPDEPAHLDPSTEYKPEPTPTPTFLVD